MDSQAVLILPIVEWEFRRQRPQQLARCFARSGHRVFYPALRLAAEPSPPWVAEAGVVRFTLVGDPGLDPYRHRLDAAAVERALAGLRALAATHPLDGCWVVAHLPFWRPLAEAARAAFGGRLLFDCMDDFASFGDHADLADEEAALARTADLVTVTAQRLHDKHAPANPRTVLVHNGCEPEHFGPAAARRPAGERPVVGFFGGIHDWFDGALVEGLARSRPGWDVWLVGDTYRGDVAGLYALPNVAFLGELPYAELPRVVSFFDVGIIPFKVTPLTEATDPVKVYEMLAAGLPVVATDLPELRRLAPWVALARTADELVARVEAALAEPPAAREARRDVARSHSWVERFLTLRRAMDEVEAASPAPRRGRPAPTREALGLTGFGDDRAELERRLAGLQAALDEGERLAELAGRLDAERLSLLEQRDRVEAEAGRLRRELDRVEAERLGLERALAGVTASRWWRLGRRLRRLVPRPRRR